MKQKWSVGIVLVMFSVFLPIIGGAQDPITLIIKEGVSKVIKAVDLKIQRLQNETIWLQNAQKVLENKMTQVKLGEIADWVEKQRTLYREYFEELWRVKAAIVHYQRVKELMEKQVQLVKEYKRAIAQLRQDKMFTPDELEYMQAVYHGILEESIKNLDQVYLVVSSYITQISDASRLEIIHKASDNLEQNLTDLRLFNHQNKMLHLQRASERGAIEKMKKIYGF